MKEFLAVSLILSLASALPSQSGSTKITVRTSERSPIPAIDIVFPDGHEDTLVLNYYYPTREAEAENSHTCNLFGHLKNEPTACVGVSGCYGEEDMHFTINSLHNQETNGYILKTTGELIMVENEFASGKAKAEAITMNGDFLEIPGNLTKTVSGAREDRATSVPPGRMTVKFGYENSFYAQFQNNAAAINSYVDAMMVHMQAFYCLSSLGTKIQLERVGDITYHAGNVWKAEGSYSLAANGPINTITENSPINADIFVYLCRDPEYYGTVGLGWLGTVCIWKKYSCSISEWRNTVIGTARLVVHEMGHNLGMYHDFDPVHNGQGCNGNGFMSYGSPPDQWSTCSKSDLLSHYNQVLTYAAQYSSVNWCISNEPNVCSGTTAPSPTPSPPSACGNFIKNWFGDGYCDDIMNNDACGFDGGDCCFSRRSNYKAYCTECACKQSCPDLIKSWWGDKYCDDQMNNAACSYDGGDCCAKKTTAWNAFCNECSCKDPFYPLIQ